MLMDTADSKLNRQTTPRDALEDTAPLEHTREATPDVEAYLAVPDDMAEGETASLHLYTAPGYSFSALLRAERVG